MHDPAVAVAGHTPRAWRADPWLAVALISASVGLAAALVVAVSQHLAFGFADSASHVVIPRRVFDNLEPGLAQLGTHWGPLFHVLQLPLVWIDPLYTSGASGIVVSLASSLVTTFYLYRLGLLVDAARPAAFLAVLVMIANPNFLYSGVIPMLPAAVMATTTANVYYLTRWAMTGSGTSLVAAGICLTAATLTHFDTWVLAPLELGIVLVVTHHRWHQRVRTEATILLWVLGAGYGIFLFALMNVMIFGDTMAFLRPFEGSSADALGGRTGVTALLDYPRSAWAIAGPVLAGAGLVGASLCCWRWRRDARLVTLLLVYPFAWYTFQSATVGSAISPADHLGDWRNIRYSITIIPALAFFAVIGPRTNWMKCAIAVAVLVGSAAMAQGDKVAAWESARTRVPYSAQLSSSASWLADRAGSGQILMATHHDPVDRFEWQTKLDTSVFVDANDTNRWQEVRAHPSRLRGSEIEWIVWFGNRDEVAVRRMIRATDARLCKRRVMQRGPLLRIYSAHSCQASIK